MKPLLTFFAGILSVIAVGVLAIAYSLIVPRTGTADAAMLARPMYASDRAMLPEDVDRYGAYAGQPAVAYPGYRVVPASDVRAVPAVETYQAPRRAATVSQPVSYQERPARVVRPAGRDWKKTAMIIGGSSAAGAGLGAIFGGKKGALIGAAIGGGASTIYEVQKRR
jgi:hypothetical protein